MPSLDALARCSVGHARLLTPAHAVLVRCAPHRALGRSDSLCRTRGMWCGEAEMLDAKDRLVLAREHVIRTLKPSLSKPAVNEDGPFQFVPSRGQLPLANPRND